MSAFTLTAGTTSQSVPIRIYDSSSTVGAGLASLAYNTSGLTCKYRREGAASWVTVTLATMTAGTWVSGGFVESSSGEAGGYELGIPNAAIAAGAKWVAFELYGASNMLLCPFTIKLDAFDTASSTVDVGKVAGSSVSGVSDFKATGFSTHSAADVWTSGTRTLSSFGTLVSDITTAVWTAASRTLTAFGFNVGLDAAGMRDALGMGSADMDDQLDAILTAVGNVDGGGGEGIFSVSLTIRKTDLSLVPEADVTLTTSSTSASTNVHQRKTANNSGVVTFDVNEGTYYVWRERSGVTFNNPATLVVDAVGDATISGGA